MVITPDATSTVGGYYPVTVAFNPTTSLVQNSLIQISPLILGDNPSDCTNDIPSIAALTTYLCSYSSNTVTITYTGATTLTSANRISITIKNTQYNTKKSATSLTVNLMATSTCQMETGVDSTMWVPQNAAKFQASSTFSYPTSTPTATCNTQALLLWSLQPTIQITTTQLVVFSVTGATPTTTSVTVSGPLTATSSSGSVIQGQPSSAWLTTNPKSIFMYYFTLPATEQPFTSTVTTYYGTTKQDSDIVHQQTFPNIAATRRNSTLIIYRNYN